MIESILYTHLKDEVTLVDGRVYPMKMAQDSLKPALVYTVIEDSDRQFMSGSFFNSDIRIQLDCYAESYLDVQALKAQVKEALYSFDYPPFELSSRDIYEDDTKLYRQLIDFNIKVK